MIDSVFEDLVRLGAVRSQSEFSTYWLGMEESYVRGLHSKGRQPSARALATCAARLRRRAEVFGGSPVPQMVAAGLRFEALADRCVEELLTKSGA